jgi:phage/plasmid-associated DNA primase
MKKKQYKAKNNSVLDFVEKNLIAADQNESIPYGETYNRYRRFCEMEGYNKSAKKGEFGETLRLENFQVESSSRHANQVRIFGAAFLESV